MEGSSVRACPFCKARTITEKSGIYECPYCLQQFEYGSRFLSMGFLSLQQCDFAAAKKQFSTDSSADSAFGRFLAHFKIDMCRDSKGINHPVIYSYNTKSFTASQYFADALRLNQTSPSVTEKLQKLEQIRADEIASANEKCDIYIEGSAYSLAAATAFGGYKISSTADIITLRWARTYIGFVDSPEAAEKIANGNSLKTFLNAINADGVPIKKAILFCLKSVSCVALTSLASLAQIIYLDSFSNYNFATVGLPCPRLGGNASKLQRSNNNLDGSSLMHLNLALTSLGAASSQEFLDSIKAKNQQLSANAALEFVKAIECATTDAAAGDIATLLLNAAQRYALIGNYSCATNALQAAVAYKIDCVVEKAHKTIENVFSRVLDGKKLIEQDDIFTQLININVNGQGIKLPLIIALADKLLSENNTAYAKKYYKYCLNRDSLCGAAHFGLLKLQLGCHTDTQLIECGESLKQNKQFMSAVAAAHSSGDKKLATQLSKILQAQEGIVVKNGHIYRAEHFKITQAGATYIGNSPRVYIPGFVLELAAGAFFGSSVISVIIDSGLNRLQDSAFAFCKNLQYVYLPENLNKISSSAFFGCTLLPQQFDRYGSASKQESLSNWISATKNASNNIATDGEGKGVFSSRKMVFSVNATITGGALIYNNDIIFASGENIFTANLDLLVTAKLQKNAIQAVSAGGVVAGTPVICHGYIFVAVNNGYQINVISENGGIVKSYDLPAALTRALCTYNNKIYCVCANFLHIIDLGGQQITIDIGSNIITTVAAGVLDCGEGAYFATDSGIFSVNDSAGKEGTFTTINDSLAQTTFGSASCIYRLSGSTIGKNTISKIVRDRMVIYKKSLYFIECKSGGYTLTSYNGQINNISLPKALFMHTVSQPIFCKNKIILTAKNEIFVADLAEIADFKKLYTVETYTESAVVGGAIAVCPLVGIGSNARIRAIYNNKLILSDNAAGDFYIIECC